MTEHLNKSEAAALRQKAVALMKNKSEAELLDLIQELFLQNEEKASRTDELSIATALSLKLTHELDLHQIELQSQNEELMAARSSELATSEKYLELFNFAPTGYLTLSKLWTINEINLSGVKMLGKERGFLQGVNFESFVSGASKAIFNRFQDMVFKGTGKKDCEITLLAGSTMPLAVHLAGIVTEKGDQCLVNMVDISGRKLAEDLLRESEGRFRSLTETATDAIISIDSDGRINLFNLAAERIFGYPANEVIGHTMDAMIPEEYGDRHMQGIRRYLGTGRSMISGTTRELNAKRRDGMTIPIELSLSEVKLNGKINFIGIIRDISGRKAAEATVKKLSRAIEQSPVSIIITDLNGIIEYVNPKACEITGFTRDELLGNNPRMLNSGEIPAGGYDHLWNTISAGKEWNGLFHNKKKNGELYWESAAISPVTDSEGKITHYVAVKENITERMHAEKRIHELNTTLEFKVKERTYELQEVNKNLENNILDLKRAEEEIIRSRDEARKANLAKSEFLSRVSHELRTPMNAILGFAQLLDMAEPDQKQKTWVNHILSSGKQLLNLIDEVLDISHIESGKLSLLPEPLQLMDILTEVLESVQPSCAARQLKIELENSPSNQLTVISDRKRLKQALTNLLSNAVNYNRQGGSIWVRTETLPQNDAGTASIRISVKDTGTGIPSDSIPNLFVPFGRIGGEITEGEGIGIGLAVVKKIMDSLGGEVGVQSIVGEGSTFWIDLPKTE